LVLEGAGFVVFFVKGWAAGPFFFGDVEVDAGAFADFFPVSSGRTELIGPGG